MRSRCPLPNKILDPPLRVFYSRASNLSLCEVWYFASTNTKVFVWLLLNGMRWTRANAIASVLHLQFFLWVMSKGFSLFSWKLRQRMYILLVIIIFYWVCAGAYFVALSQECHEYLRKTTRVCAGLQYKKVLENSPASLLGPLVAKIK